LIAFYIGEGRIASLGDYPVFAASCTIGLTIVTLAFVWYLQGHMREFGGSFGLGDMRQASHPDETKRARTLYSDG
jgi:hypothetical protein